MAGAATKEERKKICRDRQLIVMTQLSSHTKTKAKISILFAHWDQAEANTLSRHKVRTLPVAFTALRAERSARVYIFAQMADPLWSRAGAAPCGRYGMPNHPHLSKLYCFADFLLNSSMYIRENVSVFYRMKKHQVYILFHISWIRYFLGLPFLQE